MFRWIRSESSILRYKLQKHSKQGRRNCFILGRRSNNWECTAYRKSDIRRNGHLVFQGEYHICISRRPRQHKSKLERSGL
jgi:hypothetical protein